MNSNLRHEYLRLARVFKALHEDYRARKQLDTSAKTWCNTDLFDLFLPDELTVIGQTVDSRVPGARRRREHLIPRLAVAERCIEMFDADSSLEDVATFLQKFLKIVWVSSEEAKTIDAPIHGQKQQMPAESGDWWKDENSIDIRLKIAGITWEEISAVE